MKKTLLIFLSLLLIASMLLSACDSADPPVTNDDSSQTNQTPSDDEGDKGGGNGNGNASKPSGNKPTIPTTPPEGYQFYTENNLRFAYPNDWITDADGDLQDEENNTRISIARGDDALIFQEITTEQYKSIMSPALEAEPGMEVFNEVAEMRTNAIGTKINVITLNMTYLGITMRQVTYATTVNGVPYAINLLELELDEALEETVFQSIVNLNPQATNTPSQDPSAPAGYKTVTNYNLRFAIPTDFTTSTTLPANSAEFTGGMTHISLQSGAKTTTFSELTTQSFIDTMLPELEAELEGTINNAMVSHVTNDQGLPVTVISYTFVSDGITGTQVYYAVTIDNSTHLLILTMIFDDEPLRTTIFNSLTAVSGPNASGDL